MQVGICYFNVFDVGVIDIGYMDVIFGDEFVLQVVLVLVGFILVVIDVSYSSFYFYYLGVYDDFFCSSIEFDYGVFVVGYGNEDGQDYWLVKNRFVKRFCNV